MDYFIVSMIMASAVVAGGVAFAVTRGDLRIEGRVAAAVACALLVGTVSLFIPYLPVLVCLGTVVGYLVLRRLFSAGLALAASGVVLLAGCSFSVLLMMAALESM
ncbi:hypothetical protein [Actinomadura livida]|uniref:Uncharacterized protein (DUF2062 family) n=1 Tax=Actinomadura livida TaxID=79909 RepID=A0A7W7I8H3_9ACTN|nr:MULTISPECIES: hypothetical protein [Actinomadura]MBB4772158.1 uncharacterized protein (DUF2062 family) [Actinomadura catellatispora]GGU37707.1 hypothetical protein GCM10010208_72780 [Actinomadura livida]